MAVIVWELLVVLSNGIRVTVDAVKVITRRAIWCYGIFFLSEERDWQTPDSSILPSKLTIMLFWWFLIRGVPAFGQNILHT